MPTIEQNVKEWDKDYTWSEQGDEWSAAWGGTEMLWLGAILPRIHNFLPAKSILEIAPGFGRFTNYLKDLSDQLSIVDLSEKCIEACKKRFASNDNISYYVNDGRSLDMIPNQSIDFVFTFDSLVHVEADVMEAYVSQLAKKLTPDGVGFIHHSNIGAYLVPFTNEPLVLKRHWRARSMTAKRFEEFCNNAGLQCISQELIDWGGSIVPIDSLSVFTPKNSRWARPNKIWGNTHFMKEAKQLACLSELYTQNSFKKTI